MRTIVTITGPSLSGKSTLAQNLQRRNVGLEELISSTTRPRRDGEIDGKHYYFLTPEEFEGATMFHPPTIVAGNRYGLEQCEMDRVLSKGAIPMIVVDPYGANQFRQEAHRRGWRHLAIFVNSPMELRAERFIRRVLGDAKAQPENYARRLVNMFETEAKWFGQGTWDLLVPRYDDETKTAVEDIVLTLVFAEAGRGEPSSLTVAEPLSQPS